VLDLARVEVDIGHAADLVAAGLGVDLCLPDGVVHLGQDVVLESREG